MTADSSISTLTVDLRERLQAAAERVIQAVKTGTGVHVCDDYRSTAQSVSSISIGQLAPTEGAFFLGSDGHLALSEEPIAKIIALVIQDGEKRLKEKGAYVLDSEIPQLIERAFVVYLLHELRHCSQGIGRYANVKLVKSVSGSLTVAEMDVQADRDAAAIYSDIFYNPRDGQAYLEGFAEALTMSVKYFMPAFPVHEDRIDKMSRAISVLLMCARLADALGSNGRFENRGVPLDAAIFATVSSSKRELAVFRMQPQKTLIGVAQNDDLVETISKQVMCGHFESALAAAIRLLRSLSFSRRD